MVLECSAAIKESGNRYLRLMEIDIHFCQKYIFALLEIHIYFCLTWKVSIFFYCLLAQWTAVTKKEQMTLSQSLQTQKDICSDFTSALCNDDDPKQNPNSNQSISVLHCRPVEKQFDEKWDKSYILLKAISLPAKVKMILLVLKIYAISFICSRKFEIARFIKDFLWINFKCVGLPDCEKQRGKFPLMPQFG